MAPLPTSPLLHFRTTVQTKVGRGKKAVPTGVEKKMAASAEKPKTVAKRAKKTDAQP